MFYPTRSEVSTVEEGEETFGALGKTTHVFFTRSVAVKAFIPIFPPTEEDLMAIDEKCVEAGKAPPV